MEVQDRLAKVFVGPHAEFCPEIIGRIGRQLAPCASNVWGDWDNRGINSHPPQYRCSKAITSIVETTVLQLAKSRCKCRLKRMPDALLLSDYDCLEAILVSEIEEISEIQSHWTVKRKWKEEKPSQGQHEANQCNII
jgi:hypothetical protein